MAQERSGIVLGTNSGHVCPSPFPLAVSCLELCFSVEIFSSQVPSRVQGQRTIRHCDDTADQKNTFMEHKLEEEDLEMDMKSCGRKFGHLVDPTRLQSPA